MSDDDLDRLFSDARRDLPPPSELAPLAQRLNLAAPNVPTTPSSPSSHSMLRSWRVWGTTGTALAAVIAAVVTWQSQQAPVALPVAHQAPIAVAEASDAMASSEGNSPSQGSAEASQGSNYPSGTENSGTEASPRIVPRRRISPTATHETTSSAAPEPTAESEVSLMQRAVSSLRSGNLSAARAALAEHRAHFPDGLLAEERNSLEVEVLIANDPEAARARLEAFRQRYPHSAHRLRLERLLTAADSARDPAPETER